MAGEIIGQMVSTQKARGGAPEGDRPMTARTKRRLLLKALKASKPRKKDVA